MHKVVILCRRWVDWSGAKAPDLYTDSHFTRFHDTRSLIADWNRQNPNCSFYEYRLFLHELARKSWQATGAEILLNQVEPDEDVSISSVLVEQLLEADWIVPIDDDDWLSPNLIGCLSKVDPAGAGITTWQSMIVHIVGSTVIDRGTRTYLPGDSNTIISCSYALSGAALCKLNRRLAMELLLAHGHAHWAQIWFGTKSISKPLALHFRHGAAASQGEGDRRARPLQQQFDWEDRNRWAEQYMCELCRFHESCVRNDEHRG